MIMVWRRYGGLGAAMVVAALLVIVVLGPCRGQQEYLSNYQFNCYSHLHDSVTKGFSCNGVSSCQAYLTYRVQPPYTSPAAVAYLLGVPDSASRIASINNISSDIASIPVDTQLVVPVTCSCFNSTYYQHNASYTIKKTGETYLTIANDTYQGLTTCQAMMFQNSISYQNLTAGMKLMTPLRCACPTSNQSSLGYKYLLTYMATWGDDISSIAKRFGTKIQDVLDGNELSSSSLIFPFNPILVPLTTEPKAIQLVTNNSESPPQVVSSPSSDSSSKKNKWIYVGVGIGVGTAILLLLFVLYGCRRRRSRLLVDPSGPPVPQKFGSEPSSSYCAIPVSSGSWSVNSKGIDYGIESLAVYSYNNLMEATGNFGEESKINGSSVHRGTFKGHDAAVKVMKGDVSSEIGLLMKINHSNIIRLSGFCVHEGNTYLVYEFAENGSLSDLLHGNSLKNGRVLSWKQRIQIASDVADALNYLHNYTSPSYVHKNLTSRSVLVDGDYRAKLTNFAFARPLKEEGEGKFAMQLHLTPHVVGSHGYMAPEYVENGVVSAKVDVYAFGVILLELLSGKHAVSVARYENGIDDSMLSAVIFEVLDGDGNRDNLQEFLDPALGGMYPLEMALSMAELAKSCVSRDLNARPSMDQVIMTLSIFVSSSMSWDPSTGQDDSKTKAE